MNLFLHVTGIDIRAALRQNVLHNDKPLLFLLVSAINVEQLIHMYE